MLCKGRASSSEGPRFVRYDDLKAAKEKQIAALNAELREKESRVANQKAVLAETKENHEDATAALAADETCAGPSASRGEGTGRSRMDRCT